MKKIKTTLALFFCFVLSVGIAASGPAAVFASTSYSASSDNTHAITADGKTVTYSDITVTKTGDGSGDEADFYGKNAAVFATNSAALTISNATITTNGQYANAVFSYGSGTTVTISDSTINTTQRNSGGIMVTGGGTLNANNLTIVTEGGSSAAIRSDRGGGTMVVDGGSYTANGSGSPAIYSTADITVSNATLKSGTAQAVVVEGGNTVTLTNCTVTGNNTVQNSDKSSYYQAVMLYQSMSGDAADGAGSFTMSGGSLKSLNGGMFFVTNASYTINLSDVSLTYADDELLRACAAGWGNSGSNGGKVTLNANNQDLEGTIVVDSVSELDMALSNGSSFTGSFENEGDVSLEISEDSSWTLTADSSITSLSSESGSIHLNGHTLTVGGEEYSGEEEEETAQVTGLAATVSGTTAKLSWTKLSNASTYYVYQSASKSSGFTSVGSASSNTYSVTGLSYGTTYYFKVRAKLSSGEYSDYSSVLTVTVSKPQVTGLKATVSGTTAKLSWTKLSSASTYYVYQSASKSSGFTSVGSASSNAYSVTGLSYGTTCYFKVRAKLSSGEYSDYSSVLTVTVSKPQLTGLKATVSGTTVNLSWTKLTDAKTYYIYQSASKSSGFSKVGSASSNAYSVTGLSYGTTCYFKVRAKMSNGEYCTYSSVLTVTVSKPQVTGLKATVSGTTAKLSWTKLTNAKTYYIYQSTSKSSGFSKVGSASSNAYSVTGLSYGKTYYFKVRAKMSTGDYSEYSSVVKAAVPLPQVTGLKATVSGTTAKLSWTKLSGAKKYYIYQSASKSSGFSKIDSESGTSCSVKSLSYGKTYYFKVRAKMSTGDYSEYSSVVKAAIPLPQVTGLKATVSGTTAKLSWTKLTNAKKYYIYQSTSKSSGFSKIDSESGTSCSVKSLSYGKTYYFKVRAKMSTGDYSEYSSVVKAAISLPQVTGLTVTAGGTTAKLSWTKLSNASTYYVYQSFSKTSGFEKVGTSTGTSCSIKSLSKGKTYYFKVRAKLSSGTYSAYSNVVTVSILKAPYISGKNLAGLNVELKWNAVDNAKSYIVYRSASKDSGFKAVKTTTGTSYSSSALTFGTIYYYKVRAVSAEGCYSDYSNVFEYFVFAVEHDKDAHRFSWKTVPGATSYVIYQEEEFSDKPYCLEGRTPFAKINKTYYDYTPLNSCDYRDENHGKTQYYEICVDFSDNTCHCSFERVGISAECDRNQLDGLSRDGASSGKETTEECSEDGSSCTLTSKVCTDTECTITSKVCVVVGDQKACADPVVTVVPVLTETPQVEVTPTEEPTAELTPEATEELTEKAAVTETAVPAAETTEECSEDGSSCTILEKVCTDTECTITSKVCVVVGGQKACAEPMVTVVPVLTETPEATEEASAEPTATEEVPAEPTVTEEASAEPTATEEVPAEPTVTEEAPAEPTVTEEVPAEPAATEEAPAEPTVTEEVPAEPAATEEVPTEPAATEDVPAEPTATEDVPAEPAATEEVPTEPAVTEEIPAEPEVTEEIPAEPAVTEEVPAEPTATEEVPAEPEVTEEILAESFVMDEVSQEPEATEDLTIREISIADLTDDTITFNAQDSYVIAPEKLKIVPEAADWTALTFKLDDESVAAIKSTDLETIKAEGLTLNGLVQGSTTLRIQAGDVEKTVTLVINLSAAEAEALAQAEAAPEEVPAE